MGHVLRTVALCALIWGSFGTATWWLTDGLTTWTFEELRRSWATQGRLKSPALQVRTSTGRIEEFFGQTQSSKDAARAYLVDFFYASCPTVCRTLGSEFSRAQDQLDSGEHPGVALLSLSFDLSRDSQGVLQEYAARHRADPKHWTVGAPISKQSLQTIMSGLGVVAVPDGLDGFVHNAAIHVVDRHGRLIGIYDLDAWQDALRAAERVAQSAP